ncbi:hypothetical protein TFLX_02830 [Thermoflexales bacterium]|nr:hypothetical protein TFLX_02830 [Thermoflexales bacterium]
MHFQLTHGNEVNAHLQLLGSYWTQDLPLSAKLTRAVQAYPDGGRRAWQDAMLTPAYRVVLLVLFIAPIGGVLVQANVLRNLILVMPAALLTTIGVAAFRGTSEAPADHCGRARCRVCRR